MIKKYPKYPRTGKCLSQEDFDKYVDYDFKMHRFLAMLILLVGVLELAEVVVYMVM